MNFFQRSKLKNLRKKIDKLYALHEQQHSDASVKNIVAANFQLAAFYGKHYFDKGLPHARDYQLECYRANASLGDPKGQYLCGEALLNQGRFWDAWSKNPIYGMPIHIKYATNYFDEAFGYLRAADTTGYPLAKRMLGLAYIHGWGMDRNPDQGFKLVLESIDEEKAWDRATKIFEELKLNSPEFFAALRNFKGSSS